MGGKHSQQWIERRAETYRAARSDKFMADETLERIVKMLRTKEIPRHEIARRFHIDRRRVRRIAEAHGI